MHRDHIKAHKPIRFNDLCLSGELWTCLSDLNEQARSRLELIIEQMKAAEGVTERMKRQDQMAWVGAMNNIRNRAEQEELFKKYNDCVGEYQTITDYLIFQNSFKRGAGIMVEVMDENKKGLYPKADTNPFFASTQLVSKFISSFSKC